MSKKIIAAIVCIGMSAYSFAQKNKMDSLAKEAKPKLKCVKVKKRALSAAVMGTSPVTQSVKAITPPGLTMRTASAIRRGLSST